MMKNFIDELDELFHMNLMELKTFNSNLIALSASGILNIGNKAIVFDSKIIIDDILLWCNIKKLIVSYF